MHPQQICRQCTPTVPGQHSLTGASSPFRPSGRCGLTGALLPDVRRRSGGRRTHHTSRPKESLLTACRVQSRMSMGSSALLSGTDLLRLGEGFSGSAGDSELHRICAAVRQAVSGGMLVMRAGAGSFCGRLLNGQGRRPCRPARFRMSTGHSHKPLATAGTG